MVIVKVQPLGSLEQDCRSKRKSTIYESDERKYSKVAQIFLLNNLLEKQKGRNFALLLYNEWIGKASLFGCMLDSQHGKS